MFGLSRYFNRFAGRSPLQTSLKRFKAKLDLKLISSFHQKSIWEVINHEQQNIKILEDLGPNQTLDEHKINIIPREYGLASPEYLLLSRKMNNTRSDKPPKNNDRDPNDNEENGDNSDKNNDNKGPRKNLPNSHLKPPFKNEDERWAYFLEIKKAEGIAGITTNNNTFFIFNLLFSFIKFKFTKDLPMLYKSLTRTMCIVMTPIFNDEYQQKLNTSKWFKYFVDRIWVLEHLETEFKSLKNVQQMKENRNNHFWTMIEMFFIIKFHTNIDSQKTRSLEDYYLKNSKMSEIAIEMMEMTETQFEEQILKALGHKGEHSAETKEEILDEDEAAQTARNSKSNKPKRTFNNDMESETLHIEPEPPLEEIPANPDFDSRNFAKTEDETRPDQPRSDPQTEPIFESEDQQLIQKFEQVLEKIHMYEDQHGVIPMLENPFKDLLEIQKNWEQSRLNKTQTTNEEFQTMLVYSKFLENAIILTKKHSDSFKIDPQSPRSSDPEHNQESLLNESFIGHLDDLCLAPFAVAQTQILRRLHMILATEITWKYTRNLFSGKIKENGIPEPTDLEAIWDPNPNISITFAEDSKTKESDSNNVKSSEDKAYSDLAVEMQMFENLSQIFDTTQALLAYTLSGYVKTYFADNDQTLTKLLLDKIEEDIERLSVWEGKEYNNLAELEYQLANLRHNLELEVPLDQINDFEDLAIPEDMFTPEMLEYQADLEQNLIFDEGMGTYLEMLPHIHKAQNLLIKLNLIRLNSEIPFNIEANAESLVNLRGELDTFFEKWDGIYLPRKVHYKTFIPGFELLEMEFESFKSLLERDSTELALSLHFESRKREMNTLTKEIENISENQIQVWRTLFPDKLEQIIGLNLISKTDENIISEAMKEISEEFEKLMDQFKDEQNPTTEKKETQNKHKNENQNKDKDNEDKSQNHKQEKEEEEEEEEEEEKSNRKENELNKNLNLIKLNILLIFALSILKGLFARSVFSKDPPTPTEQPVLNEEVPQANLNTPNDFKNMSTAENKLKLTSNYINYHIFTEMLKKREISQVVVDTSHLNRFNEASKGLLTIQLKGPNLNKRLLVSNVNAFIQNLEQYQREDLGWTESQFVEVVFKRPYREINDYSTIMSSAIVASMFIFAAYKFSKKRKNMTSFLTDSISQKMKKNFLQKKYRSDKLKVKFDKVLGCDSAKHEIQEMVSFLESPEDFLKAGARQPKGALLSGPPGTGKTLLAKAAASEANVPFFYVSGSEFVNKYVGVGASTVRDLFTQAKEHAPSLIFIDEVDAIGIKRRTDFGGGSERETTLNQLLVEMDGFNSNDQVIVIAATNRPESLDAALRRPGRFDRQIRVDLPALQGRVDILKMYLGQIRLEGYTENLREEEPKADPKQKSKKPTVKKDRDSVFELFGKPKKKETPKVTTKKNTNSKTDSQKKKSNKNAAQDDKGSIKTPKKQLNPFETANQEFRTFPEVLKEAREHKKIITKLIRRDLLKLFDKLISYLPSARFSILHSPEIRNYIKEESSRRKHRLSSGPPFSNDSHHLSQLSERLATLSPNFSGADLKNLTNEAAILAARNYQDFATSADFEEASERILGGLKSPIKLDDEMKKIVAVHESGHAIAAWFSKGADPLVKVTIIPRSKGSLGFAQYLTSDEVIKTKSQIEDMLVFILGGRVAEEIFIGSVGSGAHDDLEKAFEIARAYVSDYGMSERFRLVSFKEPEKNESFNDGTRPNFHSELTQEAIDEEIFKIIEQSTDKCRQLLTAKGDILKNLSQNLIEKETLDLDSLLDILGPRPAFEDNSGNNFIQDYIKNHWKSQEERQVPPAEEI